MANKRLNRSGGTACLEMDSRSPPLRLAESFGKRRKHLSTSAIKRDPEIFIAFFGGAGDGPGMFNSQIVESVASAGFDDPRQIGLGGASISKESKYLEWSDAAFGSSKAKNLLAHISEKCLATPVVIVAHSYGAEAAVRTICKLKTTVAHLVTIDAVSWESKVGMNTKPSNVLEWTNIYVSGVHDFTDVIAFAGGQWKKRDGADRNIDAAQIGKKSGVHISHGTFLAMWRMALPYVRKSLGLS